YWDGAQYNLEQQKGGSGIYRTLRLAAGNTFFTLGTASLYGEVATSAGDGLVTFDCVGMNASAGSQSFFVIAPSIMQTGSAGYTVLLVNAFQSTTGSGLKYLADFQLGGVSRMRLNSAGQLQLGSSTLNSSALLQLDSTTSGLLLPRLTTTQRNLINSPAAGLMIYNTDSALVNYY